MPEDWIQIIKKRKRRSGEEVSVNIYTGSYTTSNGTEISLKFIPLDSYGQGRNRLYVEFSFPRLVHGCNHKMIDNWEAALDRANEELAKIPGLPPLSEIRDALLSRLDIPYNFQVGRDVANYIQALWKTHYPRRKKGPYENLDGSFGITFMPKGAGISTSAYDKEADCKSKHKGQIHEEAAGILRLEVRISNKTKITRLFGIKNMTLRDLTTEAITKLLKKELKTLHLDQPVICNRQEIEKTLSEMYPPRTVRSILGYLDQTKSLTHEQMIRQGTSRKTICHYEKLLRDAGISSLSSDPKVSLPPLSIE